MERITLWRTGHPVYQCGNTHVEQCAAYDVDTLQEAYENVLNQHSKYWIKHPEADPPYIEHFEKGWKLFFYPTQEEAERATFRNDYEKKESIYRQLYNISNDEEVQLKCWERFAIPKINHVCKEEAQVIYECPRMRLVHFYETTSENIDNGCRSLNDITKESIGMLNACMNCPKRDQ